MRGSIALIVGFVADEFDIVEPLPVEILRFDERQHDRDERRQKGRCDGSPETWQERAGRRHVQLAIAVTLGGGEPDGNTGHQAYDRTDHRARPGLFAPENGEAESDHAGASDDAEEVERPAERDADVVQHHAESAHEERETDHGEVRDPDHLRVGSVRAPVGVVDVRTDDRADGDQLGARRGCDAVERREGNKFSSDVGQQAVISSRDETTHAMKMMMTTATAPPLPAVASAE